MSAVSSWHHRPGDPERHASLGASAEGPGHQQAAVTGQSHPDDIMAGSIFLSHLLLMMSLVAGSAGPAKKQLWAAVQDEGCAKRKVNLATPRSGPIVTV